DSSLARSKQSAAKREPDRTHGGKHHHGRWFRSRSCDLLPAADAKVIKREYILARLSVTKSNLRELLARIDDQAEVKHSASWSIDCITNVNESGSATKKSQRK